MAQEQLFFSIIIPTYNRPERLTTCLESLTRLNYPWHRFEVIVVDDGSKTPLENVVARFQDTLNLTLLRQPNAGPASARNAGAATARGKYLAFTDDDCTPASNWLQVLETYFTTTPDCAIGGLTLNALPDNLYSTASQILIDYLYEYFNPDPERSRFFASNNFALPAKYFRQSGSFDTSFPLAAGEDRELCDRLLYYGYPMRYAKEAQIYHAHKLSLTTFWRQHFNYGRGAFHFHQLRSRRKSEQIKVEPLSFYFNLLKYPFSHSSRQPGLLLAALLFLSQVANIAGFFWERNQVRQTEVGEKDGTSLLQAVSKLTSTRQMREMRK
ncbi:glycosyltransferase family 2 protein [Microseira wollei]|uniref:Glycosyl transferase family 2 n=1 Tax=Microseira wollei NIES-4236 TaxID=2530354 RepID=A0AAV3XCT4_9CYAN|nr:glycosyltransferase [Microseira wollei]GET37212.1 glycosyl transferase family 2 [Microseira wollei NIES-4236]